MGEKKKPGGVAQSEGIPLHTSHRNKEESRVCACAFCVCSTFSTVMSILGTDIMFSIKPANF